MPCPHCQLSVKKTILVEHTSVECRRRPVSCPDCVEIFVYEERAVILVLELEIHTVVVSAANKSPHNMFFVAL